MQPAERKIFRMAKVDPSYSSGLPRLLFDGETVVSQKRYPYLGNYTPVAGDRVLLAVVGGTYVVLGKIQN